jgi:hypothetical protein
MNLHTLYRLFDGEGMTSKEISRANATFRGTAQTASEARTMAKS